MNTMPEADFIDKVLHPVYSFTELLYQPFGWVIDILSGDQDYISYPIIISSFLLFLLVFYRFGLNSRRITNYLLILSITYAFFFLAFSSGIIWYGYLLFPLLLIGIMNFVEQSTSKKSDNTHSVIRSVIGGLSIIWIVMIFITRISNLQANLPLEHQGKTIISEDVYQYNTCLLYTSPSPRDATLSRMPSSA